MVGEGGSKSWDHQKSDPTTLKIQLTTVFVSFVTTSRGAHLNHFTKHSIETRRGVPSSSFHARSRSLQLGMAPLDPLTLAWLWFSELVPGQGSCHPTFLMISGKWTHAHFEIKWNLISAFPLWILCDAPFLVLLKKTDHCFFATYNSLFLHSIKTIFNGTRLDRRGLKS